MTKRFFPALLLVLATATAGAQNFLYTQDFELPDGPDLPQDWISNFRSSGSVDILTEELRIIREDGGFQGAAFYNGTIDNLPATEWADYTVSAVFRMGSNSGDGVGLAGRAQNNSRNFNGYNLTLSRSNHFRLEIDPFTFGNNGGIIAEITDDDPEWVLLENGVDYYMTFTLIGNQLSGAIYGEDNGQFTDLIMSISGVDTNNTYMTGRPGVRAVFGNNNRRVYYDTFQVHVIPEPSSLLLLGAALSLLAVRRRYSNIAKR